MPTLIENLSLINSYKSDIKYAIEKQGVDMTGVSFGSFADKIGEITTEFVTEPLSVSVNGTYTPGQGVDGYSQVNVSVPDGDGTWSNPYNVLDAINVINGSPEGTSSMYVRAFVTAISSAYSQTGNYGNADFHVGISGSNYLRAYRLNYFDGKKYTSYPGEASKPDIHIGDEVIMYGQFKIYNNTPQTVANAAYLYAINGVYDISVGPGTEYYIEQNGYYSSLNYYEYIEVSVPAPAPVTESLSVSVNGTYTPSQGVDGFSQVVVDVPQSVTGYTESEITEGVQIVNLNNSAGYVGQYAFAGKNIQTVDLPEASYIGSYGFYECSSLTTVNLPVCFSVSGSAFAATTSMTSISLPVCFSLEGTALAVCGCSEIELPMLISGVSNLFRGSYLRSLSIPMCNSLRYYTFQQCSNLQTLTLGTHQYDIVPYDTPFVNMGVVFSTITIYVNSERYNSYITANGWSSFSSRFVSVSLPDPVLSYSDGRLYGCTYYVSQYIHEKLGIQRSVVTEIDLPECKYIGPSTFSGYNNVESLNVPNAVYISNGGVAFSKITTLNLPNCLYLGDYAVFGCYSLTSVSLPECRYIGLQAFGYGSNITSINLPECRYIASSAFRQCGSAPLYIGTNAVCVLGGSDLGYSYTGSIYVPASLVDAYKSAPNWSAFSSRIFPIPE